MSICPEQQQDKSPTVGGDGWMCERDSSKMNNRGVSLWHYSSSKWACVRGVNGKRNTLQAWACNRLVSPPDWNVEYELVVCLISLATWGSENSITSIFGLHQFPQGSICFFSFYWSSRVLEVFVCCHWKKNTTKALKVNQNSKFECWTGQQWAETKALWNHREL